LRYLALAALLLTACTRRSPATLTVAAASDLQFAMQEITEPFRAAHRELDLRIVYGSSGNFFTQIRNGAPFDVYLSADMSYPRQLTATPGDVFRYAVGRIVLWTPPGSPLDPATALQDVRLQRLAIANPAHAPYGRAAEATLRAQGLYDTLKPKLVFGENIAQTLQFVQSGAADAGIVALSLVLAPQLRGKGRYLELPQSLYPPLEQGGIILHDSPEAREFRDLLLSPAAGRVLTNFGFSLPQPRAGGHKAAAFCILTSDS